MITLHSVHFTLLFAEAITVVNIGWGLRIPLFTDPAARGLTSRKKYFEEVEERVLNKNDMYF